MSSHPSEALDVVVRDLAEADIPRCAEILAALPEWFGFPEVNEGYISSLTRLPSFVAESDGTVAGFIALSRYGEVAAEIHVLAVDRTRHRRGIGRALVERARLWCRENDVRWLHVKTRGPSTPDPNYDGTRLFYLAEGFEPLYESSTEWGPMNAALVLVQAIEDRSRPTDGGISAIDHVQLAMPAGEEDAARAFYGGLLGLTEIPKPPELAKRGGAWFEGDAARVHLGVEDDFRPARKAHPALLVHGLGKLLGRLRDAGVTVIDDDALPGYERAYVHDPFGNRIELMEPDD